jgi:hypothetical protein
MKTLLTKNLKVKFLGITPVLKDETGFLNPQEIVSFSALLTFKGKSVEELLKETIKKGQNVKEKIINILRKSSLKGHASLATTPVLCFSYEASKFLDSGLTGMVFASALMASGRRTDTTTSDIVYPTTILKSKRTKEIYKKASEANINFFNRLLTAGIHKDEASKILQYGIYGTGIIQFPIESLVSLKREYEAEKDWMPEEIGFLLNKIEKELKKLGVDLLYVTRLTAPRNTYPYPNIFRNPRKSNLARDLMKNKDKKNNFKIISSDFNATPGLRGALNELKKEIRAAIRNKKVLKNNWLKLILKRRQIARDYNLAASVKILSSVAWRVWGDKKRHRTVPMTVESAYYCTKRATEVFRKNKKGIKKGSLNEKALGEINDVFSIPPSVRNDKNFLYGYLDRALDSLETYSRLVNLGVKEKDAIFIVPRGLKLDVLQDYNFYNLIAGYYPLRICSTAEEELRRLSLKEVAAIKKILIQKKLNWLAEHIVPKCQVVGFCLEEKFCPLIKGLVPNYNEKLHQEMKQDLEKKFQKNIKKLGKR